MAFSDIYDFEDITYGTTGWNGIQQTNNEKIESHLHTRLLAILGETVDAYKAVYISSDSKYYKSLSNLTLQPALGLTIEAGVLDDEVRVQRVGPITNVAWSWTPGKPVYLSGYTAGELTQVDPVTGSQFMGMAISTTTILLNGTITTTSLTSATTTSTTTTSSSTSSTVSSTSSSTSSTSTT